MPGQGVTLYATTAGGNKVVLGAIDWREAIYMPAQINDNVGQIMADIRAMANSIATGWIEFGDGDGVYTATYIAANQFRIDGADVSAYYRVGMRVRAVAPTPGTISGTISAVAYSAPNTLVTVTWDSGAGLSNEAITAILIGIGSGGGAGGQLNYRNILGRNGGFEVWQRGAGGSANIAINAAAGAYTADGWWLNTANNSVTVSQVPLGVSPSRYAGRVIRNAGQTGTGLILLEFPLDSDEIVLARGSIVTLSMLLGCGANYSAVGSALTVLLVTGTGSPARYASVAYTGRVDVIAATPITLTTTLTRTVITSAIAVPTNATQASVVFQFTPVGTAGADDSFYVDDVQLEVGSFATPFERRPFESELQACRRHYQKSFEYSVAPAQNAGNLGMFCISQTVAALVGMYTNTVPMVPPMRVVPTYLLYNPYAVNAQARNVNTTTDCTGTAAYVGGSTGFNLVFNAASGSVPGNLIGVHWTTDAGI